VGDAYALQGEVQRVATANNEQRVPIEIELTRGGTSTRGVIVPVAQMKSTVTAQLGKPVVLGQSTGTGATILIITPTIAK
jgi:hypothetical protein